MNLGIKSKKGKKKKQGIKNEKETTNQKNKQILKLKKENIYDYKK